MFKLTVPPKGTISDSYGLLAEIPECGGYYNAVIDGKRFGPLVMYAGKYGPPEALLNWVGDEYFNFAKVEERVCSLMRFAEAIADSILLLNLAVDAVVGAPMGGLTLAGQLAWQLECGFFYPEKKVLKVVEGGRDVTEMRWDRHELPSGLRVAVVEDVTNNFSTADQMIQLVEAAGSKVIALTCALNRSPKKEFRFGEETFPVVAAVHRITPQFNQEDAYTAHLIRSGQLETKPEPNWEELMAKLEANYNAGAGIM